MCSRGEGRLSLDRAGILNMTDAMVPSARQRFALQLRRQGRSRAAKHSAVQKCVSCDHSSPLNRDLWRAVFTYGGHLTKQIFCLIVTVESKSSLLLFGPGKLLPC